MLGRFGLLIGFLIGFLVRFLIRSLETFAVDKRGEVRHNYSGGYRIRQSMRTALVY